MDIKPVAQNESPAEHIAHVALLPCPFCGADASHYPDGEMEGYAILCNGRGALFNAGREHCPLASFGYATPEDAERAWNTRAIDVSMQWIDVRTRLPDEYEDGSQIIGCFQYPGESCMVGAINTSTLLAGKLERVSHWMPLPEPPAVSGGQDVTDKAVSK